MVTNWELTPLKGETMTRRKRTPAKTNLSPIGKFYKKVADATLNRNGWKGICPKAEGSLEATWTVLSGEYTGTWKFSRSQPGICKISYSPKLKPEIEFNNIYRLSPGTKLENKRKEGLCKLLGARADRIEEIYRANPDLSQWPCSHSTSMRIRLTHDWDEVYAMFEQAGKRIADWEYLGTKCWQDNLMKAATIWRSFSSHKDRVRYSNEFLACNSPLKALPSWVKRVGRWKDLVNHDAECIKLMRYMPRDWWVSHKVWSWQDRLGEYYEGRGYERCEYLDLNNEANKFKQGKVPWTVARKVMRAGCSAEVFTWAKACAESAPGKDGRKIRRALLTGNYKVLAGYHDVLMALELRRQQQERDEAAAIEYAKGQLFRNSCPWEDRGIPYRLTVKVLRTEADLIQEGDEMRHCIGTYARKTGTWFLSMIHENGNRTTAEVQPDGCIIQHVGFANKNASWEEGNALRRYLAEMAIRERLVLRGAARGGANALATQMLLEMEAYSREGLEAEDPAQALIQQPLPGRRTRR
jgi:hypothetical protein